MIHHFEPPFFAVPDLGVWVDSDPQRPGSLLARLSEMGEPHRSVGSGWAGGLGSGVEGLLQSSAEAFIKSSSLKSSEKWLITWSFQMDYEYGWCQAVYQILVPIY